MLHFTTVKIETFKTDLKDPVNFILLRYTF